MPDPLRMDALNGLDLAILAVLGLSAVVGLARGLVREVIAIAGWCAAVVLAIRYAEPLGDALPFSVPWPLLATLLGGALIVTGCVFVAALVGWVARRLLVAVRLSGTDRMLGAMFGMARGLLILFVVVLFAGPTPFARQAAWQRSSLLPWLERAVTAAGPWLPPALAARAGAGSARQ